MAVTVSAALEEVKRMSLPLLRCKLRRGLVSTGLRSECGKVIASGLQPNEQAVKSSGRHAMNVLQ
jgi:hypothetical protein